MSRTPGPWTVERDGGRLYIRAGLHKAVALLTDDGHAILSGLEGNDEDARLMAASPDFREAAELAIKAFDGEPCPLIHEIDDPCWLDLTKAAIAKAEGRK